MRYGHVKTVLTTLLNLFGEITEQFVLWVIAGFGLATGVGLFFGLLMLVDNHA
jgi:hypothetical protein